MSVKYNKLSRRQFLIGTGGYALFLPILPSLLSKEAFAQVSNNSKRLLVATLPHNIMASQTINPTVAPLVSAGVRQMPLNSYTGNISQFMTGSTITNNTIGAIKNAGLLTIVRGIDSITTPDGHGDNYITGSINNHGGGTMVPSFDSYLESSSTLYPSNQSYFKKVLRCNGSISYRKVGAQVTKISDCYEDNANNNWNGARKLYQDMLSLFSAGGGGPTPPAAPPIKGSILNLVMDAYNSARNNRRISNDDRNRLEEHMGLIDELENSLGGGTNPNPIPVTCNDPIGSMTLPNIASSSYKDKIEVYLKLMRVAITCGMTKVGVIPFEGHGSYNINSGGGRFPADPNVYFHDGIVHNLHNFSIPTVENQYSYWFRWHMDRLCEHVLEPLRTGEDVIANNGNTYLQNMLVAVMTEAGVHEDPGHHVNLDYQTYLFGNMNGVINSNRYVAFDRGTNGRGQGVPYNQLMITFLQAMGLPESEYVAGSEHSRGFGAYVNSGPYYTKYFNQWYSPIAQIFNG